MKKGKVLAIDYGVKMVGLASGDLEVGVAFPRAVIRNRGIDLLVDEVLAVCKELMVDLVVVGLPTTENAIVDDIKKFSNLLMGGGVSLQFMDEDFSSLEAEKLMHGFKVDRLDANAAQVILQRFFDEHGKN